jgi:hypothetical protein
MPGPAVRFDYQSLDASQGRLYIAHMNANQLVVFDTKKREVVANLDGFSRVHGVWAVPMASRRLREEIIVYVRHVGVGVDDLMFAVLFCRLADRLLRHPNFVPEWLEIGNVVRGLIPDPCFQERKKATSREISALAAGPLADPAEPFERLVIGSPVGGAELKPNGIGDERNMLLGYELWRLWDFVFHEVCEQHAAIDCEEHSNVALALIGLNPFERLAGRMFYEASETDLNRVPDDVFIRMGRQLDRERISLADNLDARGREIVKHLGRQGKPTRPRGRQHRSFLCQLAAQEIVNRTGNLLSMRFQREMAGVEEVHFGARVVALERLGPRRQKERIILSPD